MPAQRPLYDKPHGAENYDAGALDDKQQDKLNQRKIQLRIENEKYLRSHPELSLIIKDFLKEVYTNKPDNVREFAADYFTNPGLRGKLNDLKKEDQKTVDVNKIVQNFKSNSINDHK